MADEKDIQKRLASNILNLRILSCLTQDQMAEELRISTYRYSNYELGKRAIPIDTLIAISSFFDLSLEVLTKGDLSKISIDKIRDIGVNRILLPINDKKDENFDEKIALVTNDYCSDYHEHAKMYRKNIFE